MMHNLRFMSDNILAMDKVLYKRHAVAAVAASSVHVAEEALALIVVECEVLPAVLTAAEAMQPHAPLLHERLASVTNVNIRPGGLLSDDDPTPAPGQTLQTILSSDWAMWRKVFGTLMSLSKKRCSPLPYTAVSWQRYGRKMVPNTVHTSLPPCTCSGYKRHCGRTWRERRAAAWAGCTNNCRSGDQGLNSHPLWSVTATSDAAGSRVEKHGHLLWSPGDKCQTAGFFILDGIPRQRFNE
jgi:hypothetical protein